MVPVSRRPEGVKTWTVAPPTETAETRLWSWTSQELQESTSLIGVTTTIPESHAVLDSGAAPGCIGAVVAARTARAIIATGETRRQQVQRSKFGGDGEPVEASFAVTLPVQIGKTKT